MKLYGPTLFGLATRPTTTMGSVPGRDSDGVPENSAKISTGAGLDSRAQE